jgi:CO/xanthine dehydrogenase Mo-binding subunit
VAIKDACDQLKEELIKRGADDLDLPKDQVEYRVGHVQSKANQNRSVSLSDLGQASVTAGGNPLIKTGRTGSLPLAPSFAAHIVDVEVDPDTGKVTILKYTAFQDCGFAINPMQVEGQVQGGVAQGIGWALNEAYDFKDGVMQNPTWLDYRMPTALDLPMIEAELIQVPNPASPYGVRGTGEIGIVTPMGAIANAIARAIGVRLTELPMNPERVLFAMTQKDRSTS